MKKGFKILSLLTAVLTLGACAPSAPSTHIVKFETNCSETIPDQEVKHGGLISKPNDPVREGYALKAWTYKGDNWHFSEDKVMEDMTLYAKYAPNTYSVRLYDDTSFATVSVTYDKIFNFGCPEGKENIFLGWYYGDRQLTDNKGKGLKTWDIADNVSLQAKYIHAETVVIRNVLEINPETNLPELINKQVYAKHCKVASAYKTTMFVEQREGNTLGSLYSVEVRNINRDFISMCGFGSMVNVLGTVKYEDGRVIMDEAEIVVETDGVGPDKFDGLNADTFPMMNPRFSGLIVGGTFEVLDMPKLPLEVNKSYSMKFTFPGCDNRLSKDNKQLLEFLIPDCLIQEEIELLNNNFLSDVCVGDYIKLYAILRYGESFDNGFQLLYIPSLSVSNEYGIKEVKVKNLFKTVEELNTKFLAKHTTSVEEIPTLASYDNIGNNIIFGYMCDDSKYDADNNYKFEVIANTNQSGKVYKDFIAAFKKAGWIFNEDGEVENGAVMKSITGNNTVGVTATESSVIVTFLTNTPVIK